MHTREELEDSSMLGVPLDIGDGWVPIVSDWYDAVQHLGIRVEVTQVKEKFGGLRIYATVVGGVSGDLNRVESLTQLAESAASHTCEMCGDEGTRRADRSWIKTLCDACNE